MIRYSLICERDHAFESWFRDSAACETLVVEGQVACPSCHSTVVRKALMAPSLVNRRKRADAPTPEATGPAEQPPARPAALLDDGQRALRAMARDLRRRMTESADDVGRAFPTEARRIHDGEAPSRSIYGQASADEVTALLDDGVPLLPVPVLPEDQN